MNSAAGEQPRDSAGGVLPIDKPEGPTSHDMVALARRALRTRRVGHTGTLDPFASGLLLLCIGPATRLAEYLTALPKTYRATLHLGEATDTDDLTGTSLGRDESWNRLSEPEIRAALERQQGTRDQLPPIYSAKRVGGERMYAAARRGEVLDRHPVRVTIHRIEVLELRLPDVEFEVECSSGTYIRAIARDAGDALGVGAHLRALRRTRVGAHSVEGAVAADRLDDSAAVARALLPPLDALAHLPRVQPGADEERVISHGGAIAASPELPQSQPIAVIAEDGRLLAIAERMGDELRPRKVFS